MKRSITWRLAAMFAVAALITFSLIGTALYGVLRTELRKHVRESLETYTRDLGYLLERVPLERYDRAKTKMDSITPADGSVRFWVLSDDPRWLYGRDLPTIEGIEQNEDGLGRMVLPQRRHPLHTMTRLIPGNDNRPAMRLIVGIDSAAYAHTLKTFAFAMTVFSLAAVLLVAALGYWIARLGLRPLAQLSRQATTLLPNTPSQRLKAADLPHELDDLTVAFNGALGRSEDAYKRLEAFNADVAHELRTPLANMIGVTQVALSRGRSAPEFEEVLQSNLEELERMKSVVSDMLFLARADQGEAATNLVETPIGDEVRKTTEFFEFVLDEKGIAVDLQGDADAPAMIDSPLFRRAMSNLLQNAIEHSPEGGRIEVLMTRMPPEAAGSGNVQVSVSNAGSPIAADHLPRLFDRFYRVDAARHDEGEHHGHGLGLAIVRAVADMHGGSVFASSTPDGTTTIGFSVRGGSQARD